MGDKPAYTAAYTGDGIEAYEPIGVGGGAQSPPTTPRVALEAEIARLTAENQRLATLLADAENIVRDPYAVQSQLKEGRRLRDLWANALRGGDGRPR